MSADMDSRVWDVIQFLDLGYQRSHALGEAYDTDPEAVIAWLEHLRREFRGYAR